MWENGAFSFWNKVSMNPPEMEAPSAPLSASWAFSHSLAALSHYCACAEERQTIGFCFAKGRIYKVSVDYGVDIDNRHSEQSEGMSHPRRRRRSEEQNPRWWNWERTPLKIWRRKLFETLGTEDMKPERERRRDGGLWRVVVILERDWRYWERETSLKFEKWKKKITEFITSKGCELSAMNSKLEMTNFFKNFMWQIVSKRL